MRLRSVVPLPTASRIEAVLASAADAVAVTVADEAVSPVEARSAAATLLAQAHGAGKATLAWVNHPRTQLLRDDLDALVSSSLSAIALPHATEPQDVRDAAVLLREFEYTRGIEPGTVRVFPVIDSARGLLRAAEIVEAAPRVGGLVFDGAGFAIDTGARDEEHGPRFAAARGLVVAAARAVDGLPLVRTNAFELMQLANTGFAGALLPDERGAGAANAAFAPTPAQIEHARQQIATYEAAKAAGEWVGRLGSEVVDAATARKARLILELGG